MEKHERASRCRTSGSWIIISSVKDLMINILSRLPLKTLSRLRCVSKQLNLLISDPDFVSSHQARADPNIIKVLCVDRQDGLIGLCSIKEKEERMVTVDMIRPNYPDAFFPEGDIFMRGNPCNGLICLTSYDDKTFVCNPTTQNTMVIPKGNKRKSNFVEGLGYSSLSKAFKVVRLFERSEIDMSIPKNRQCYGCELFAIGHRGARQHSSSWRRVGNLPCRIADRLFNTMLYLNGSVHWKIEQLEQVNSPSSDFILSLDLELEEFKVVAHPESWAQDIRYKDLMNMHLKELGGKLCVVYEVLHCNRVDIWVLKDYTNSIWSKDYHINLPSLYNLYIDRFSAVALWRGELLVDINSDRMLCQYNPRTKLFGDIVKLEMFKTFGKMGTYAESLLAPF